MQFDAENTECGIFRETTILGTIYDPKIKRNLDPTNFFSNSRSKTCKSQVIIQLNVQDAVSHLPAKKCYAESVDPNTLKFIRYSKFKVLSGRSVALWA